LNVSTSGTYWVRVTYNGCVSRDTVNVFINPNRKNPIDYRALCNVDSIQLSKSGAAGTSYLWNTGQTTSSIFASRPGTYWVDLSLNGCTTRDTIIVAGRENLNPLGRDTRVCQSALPLTLNATVNGASGYQWQDNSRQSSFTVRQPGLYWVQLTLGGCTYRDSILVDVDSVRNSGVTATICAGANYRSPSGRLLTQTGVYSDTLRTARGCDSIITRVDLRVTALTRQSLSTSICRNQNYTLPSGRIVSTAGSYVDTVRTVQGCDSLITTVALSVNSFTTSTVNRTLCFGQTYTRPGGIVVNSNGTYIDTLRNSSGCDSIVTSNINYITLETRNISASVCAGQSYRMPAGRLVSTAGIHRDTLRSVQGCDSLETVVTLQVNSPLRVSSTARICVGSSYRLPSGRLVSTQQSYSDTLRSIAGCDSLISSIALEVVTPLRQSLNASICRNQSYTLPSGRIVSVAGSYVDTVRTVQGCDSLITTVALSVNSFTTSTVNRTLCFGQTYTRPGGGVVTTTGTFIDTLRNSSGCDSIVTSNINYITLETRNISASVCAGQSYRMPAGRLVSTAGIHRDTLRSIQGCDSLETVVTLQVNSPLRVSSTARICAGSSYRLPSGRLVSSAQTYSDTLRSAAGCDSLISSIALEVVTPLRQSLNASICRNQNYTLPSGRIVSVAGIYVDTIRTVQGCDSLITTVALTVNSFTTSTVNRTLCFGQTYTRPGGRVVSTSGTYIDTLRNASGCDSIVTSIVSISPPLSVSLAGQSLLCAGAQTQLTATASGGLGQNYTYRWIGVNANGNSISIQPNANTRVIVEVSDGCTLEPARDTLDIEVVPLPTARFTLGTKTVCAPYTLTARSEGQAPAGSRYHWDFGTGNAADSAVVANPGFTFRNAGTYIIRLRVTNLAGCVDAYQDTLVVFNSPAPEVQAVTSICTNDAVTFTDGGSGADSDQWRWNFGNGQLSSQRSPVPVRFTRAGRYTITLTRSNAGGCAVTDNHVLVVDQLQAEARASRTVFCDTGTVAFSASVRSFAADSLGDELQYLWNFGDGTTSNAASPTHHFTRTGTYRVILTVASSYGCRASDTLVVESIEQPAVRIEGPDEVCAGTPVQFQGVTERGNVLSWRWDFGDGRSATVQNPEPLVFANESSYPIRLIASSGTACADTVTRTLQVRRYPVIGIIQKSLDICRGQSVQLRALDGTQYAWTPAAGLNNPNIADPIASPLLTTTYTVRVTNAAGCSSEDTVRITVSQPFTVTASPEQSICVGESVTLNAAGAVRYLWQPIEGLSSATIANPVANPRTTTTYRVIGYGADNCFSDTAEVRVNVIPLPTVFAGNDTTIGVGQELQLRLQTSNDVTGYTWTPATFLNCTNCPTPTATPTEPIQYRVTVRNDFGCAASDDIRITLQCSADDVFIPNTFTPNGDGTNDLFYPRGKGIRTVEFFRIYNRWGEMVYERKGFALNDRTAAWDGTYKGEKLLSGVFVYTTRMICENNEVIELKGSIMIAR
jgi:gliding motility-associated-like protein